MLGMHFVRYLVDRESVTKNNIERSKTTDNKLPFAVDVRILHSVVWLEYVLFVKS